jgi:ABC-type sugar transport system substrate-binding protein
MKKFVLASLSVGAALMVAATAQTAEKNVAFVYWNTTTNAFQEMALGVKQAVKESQRVNLVSTAPNSTNPSQVVAMFQSG